MTTQVGAVTSTKVKLFDVGQLRPNPLSKVTRRPTRQLGSNSSSQRVEISCQAQLCWSEFEREAQNGGRHQTGGARSSYAAKRKCAKWNLRAKLKWWSAKKTKERKAPIVANRAHKAPNHVADYKY